MSSGQKVLEAHGLCGLFADHTRQPDTVCGCPIENCTSISSNLDSLAVAMPGYN